MEYRNEREGESTRWFLEYWKRGRMMCNGLITSAVFQYEVRKEVSICRPTIVYTMCCKASSWEGNAVEEEDIVDRLLVRLQRQEHNQTQSQGEAAKL